MCTRSWVWGWVQLAVYVLPDEQNMQFVHNERLCSWLQQALYGLAVEQYMRGVHCKL